MYEYRFTQANEQFLERLDDEGYTVIEEDFKGEGTGYVLYGTEDAMILFAEEGIDVTVTPVENTGWEEKWKEFLKEGWLTENIFYIFEDKEMSDRTTIRITPSLAFGTGTHATTRTAARLLEPVSKGRTVLDVGCGSGILAIAASLSGASASWACDIDSVALGNTAQNIADNRRENVYAWAGTLDSVRQDSRFDVIVANIISSVLLEIRDQIVALGPEYIVYSGIMTNEADEVTPLLITEGYQLEESFVIDEWYGMRLKRA